MVLIAVLGAVLAALCYGAGAVLQAAAARDQQVAGGLDVALVVRLVRQLPYVAGLGLDAVGFAASLVALRSLHLFLVQAVIASSVGVTAVLAWRFLGARLDRQDVLALSGLVLGLALLGVSAKPSKGTPLPSAAGWWALATVAALAVVGLFAPRVGAARAQAASLAVAAGVAFGGVAVSARGVTLQGGIGHLLRLPLAWSVPAFGLLGVLLFAAALQRGSVVLVVALTFAVETVTPAAVGLAWLGDTTRPGWVVAAAGGFVLSLVAAVGLARHAEPAAPA